MRRLMTSPRVPWTLAALLLSAASFAAGYDIVRHSGEIRRAGIKSPAITDDNLEANADIPEVDLILTSAPVTARPHKLRARWSIEAQQDFQAKRLAA